MTIDKINFNTFYIDSNAANMFTNPMFASSSTPMFDFTQFMPGTYMAMDNFMPTYPNFGTFPSFSSMGGFNFNFNFEMPKIDMSMLMDMYNATMKNLQNQYSNFQKMFNLNLTSNMNWNTTPTASLKDVNYDAETAKKLAQNAKANAGAKSQKRCAEFVSDAIEASGISVTRGHAFQMENNLRNNSAFKEVTVSQDELASLPAGCILVYPKGSAGYSSEYGHIEITLGNGETASDFLNTNPKYSGNMKVFVPVTA